MLKKSRLYAVLDKTVLKNSGLIFNKAEEIKNSGVDIIQYRDKESKKETVLENARNLKKILASAKAMFIINDYLDIAKLVDSDGIHLGQKDASVKTARRILGNDKIIGVSCHSLNQAVKAQNNGADYISIGPIFSTPTKPGYKAVGPDLIRAAGKKIKIPFFVIGGINENNIGEVSSIGAKRAAVCRAICRAKKARLAVKKLRAILER